MLATHLFEGAREGTPDDQRLVIRVPEPHEAADLHRLIAANVESGHLLPRSLADLTAHTARFLVVAEGSMIIACAELAPLSRHLAEIRSLIVAAGHRGMGLGTELLMAIVAKGRGAGFPSLCAFTPDPRPFVKLGFSIVPHIWLPEKIATDCHTCVWFRRCEQYAMMLDLRMEDRGLGARDRGLSATAPGAGTRAVGS